MRLIDADELKKQQTHLWDEVMGHVPCVLLYDIDKAPTIDAVPVARCKDCNQYNEGFNDGIRVALNWQVLCKDCRYSDEAKANKKGFLICPASGMEIMDDDFCSYGERRSDD